MKFEQLLVSKHFATAVLTVFFTSVFTGCKQPSTPGTEQSVGIPTATPGATTDPLASKAKAFRSGLTATQWFTKEGVTPAESKTVDALIKSIGDYGGPVNGPVSAARWADKYMQIVSLNDEGLTEISPILVFKKIVTLSMSGNNFTQDQLNELLASLPNLKTLVKDKGLKCDSIRYPKVTCIE